MDVKKKIEDALRRRLEGEITGIRITVQDGNKVLLEGHKAFQKNLVAVLNRDAYSRYFSFKTSPQRVFNFLLHVHCLHTRFDINIIWALRGKRLIKAWVRCWYEFEIFWFLMFSAG